MVILHEEHMISFGIVPFFISFVKRQNSGVSIMAVAYGGGSCCCCTELEKVIMM